MKIYKLHKQAKQLHLDEMDFYEELQNILPNWDFCIHSHYREPALSVWLQKYGHEQCLDLFVNQDGCITISQLGRYTPKQADLVVQALEAKFKGE